MNESLTQTMKSFVDKQVAAQGDGTSSDPVRELIREDQQRLALRNLLLQGGLSTTAGPADPAYFDGLRKRVREAGARAGGACGR